MGVRESLAATNNRRHYKGNPNYITWYNNHVKQFFNEDIGRFPESKVNFSGSAYQRENGYASFKGSLWTSEEKSLFFRALARHSIHRADLIQEEVQTKTVWEIYAYYDFLKSTLRQIKRKRLVSKTINGRKLHYYDASDSLVSYTDMPHSLELSEAFIQFEQVQLNHIAKKEAGKLHDDTRRFQKYSPELITQNALQSLLEFHRFVGVALASTILPYKPAVLIESLAKQKVKEMVLELAKRKLHRDTTNTVLASDVHQLETYPTNPVNQYFRSRINLKSLGLEKTRVFGRKSTTTTVTHFHPLAFEPQRLSSKKHLTLDSIERYDLAAENPELEEALFYNETKAVDAADVRESQDQEHVLLTFMATANYDKVKNLMWTNEELQNIEKYERIDELGLDTLIKESMQDVLFLVLLKIEHGHANLIASAANDYTGGLDLEELCPEGFEFKFPGVTESVEPLLHSFSFNYAEY